jgi:Group 4 capsule polysaccharide lipoprotein gfcB, YjbF
MGPRVALTGFGRVVFASLILATMSACGSDKPQASPLVQALGAVAKNTLHRGAAKGSKAAAGTEEAITRASLEELGTPVLQVAVAARDFAALLTPTDVKGSVVTWASQNDVTFTFRDSILIQTRGLGPDLMSAEAPSVSQLLAPGVTYERAYYFLGADDQPTRRKYDCTAAIVGKESLEILEHSYTVTHVVETCSRPQGSMTNEYWIDGTIVRRSHELLSGGAGYIDVARIID